MGFCVITAFWSLNKKLHICPTHMSFTVRSILKEKKQIKMAVSDEAKRRAGEMSK